MNIDFSYASQLDANDSLARFRDRFIIPVKDNREQIYFLGNSLGLQPKSTAAHIQQVLGQWAQEGVEAFFRTDNSWMHFHDRLVGPLSSITGALPSEIVVMNQLTVNLHLMMVSFYRPEGKRRKILCEAKAFPSDQYMFETHLKSMGLNPDEILIELAPRSGEHLIRAEDIARAIEETGDELALVLWGGVNYYTGQVFDLASITRQAQAVGAKVGFDLAHGVGNIALALHDWNVDFACWCSYKYLNSGPGAIAGAYIHERYHKDPSIYRLGGWWGYEKETRFKMEKGFRPIQTAEGWQLSTPSPIMYAAHLASLEIFEEAGFANCLEKARNMAAYLHELLSRLVAERSGKFEILTPADLAARGCQVSLFVKQDGRALFDYLTENGIFADWREPDVIRVAPVPLYNRFSEIARFVELLGR
ncbi:MAG TPA: kynureninase [Flavihumibacter sp.]